MQLLRQQLVTGSGVEKVYRTRIHKHNRRLRPARRQRTLQCFDRAADAGKEQVAANSPYQQSWERARIGMELGAG
jgi:hypothetical protein